MKLKTYLTNCFKGYLLDDETAKKDLIENNYLKESSLIYFITSYLIFLPLSLIGLFFGSRIFLLALSGAVLLPVIVYGLIYLFNLFIHLGLRVVGSNKNFALTNNIYFSFIITYTILISFGLIALIPIGFIPFIGIFFVMLLVAGIYYWMVIVITKIISEAHQISHLKSFWGQFIGFSVFSTLMTIFIVGIIFFLIVFFGLQSYVNL